MFRELSIERLSFGTVYKLFAIGLVIGFVPFSVLMGVLALFGSATVRVNGRALTGVAGLLAAPVAGLLLAVVFTIIMGTLAAVGLWIHSKIMPLKIVFRMSPDSDDA